MSQNDLAKTVGMAKRHVSRPLRLAYLAPEVLKRLTCGREVLAVSLYDLCFLAGEVWVEQAQRAFFRVLGARKPSIHRQPLHIMKTFAEGQCDSCMALPLRP